MSPPCRCRRRRCYRQRLSPLPLSSSPSRAALAAALAVVAALSSRPALLGADAARSQSEKEQGGRWRKKKKRISPPDEADGGWVARDGTGWKNIKGGERAEQMAAPPPGDLDSAGALGMGFPNSILLLPPWDQISAHGGGIGNGGGVALEIYRPAADLADRIMKRMFVRRDGDGVDDGGADAGREKDESSSPFARRAKSRFEKSSSSTKNKKGRNAEFEGCDVDGLGGGGRGRKRRALRRWWRRRRNDAESRTAYGMAVLSSLAYWEFHRKPLPEGSRSGFRVAGRSSAASGTRSGSAARFGGRWDVDAGEAAAVLERQLRGLASGARGVLRRARREAEIVADLFLAPHLATFAQISPSQGEGGGDEVGNIPHIGSPSKRKAGAEDSNPEDFTGGEEEDEERDGDDYTLEYYFYNWHEPGKFAGGAVKWHDTDLLVSSSPSPDDDNGRGKRRDVVLTFAGTRSPSDHATNAQTFEPASHSGLFGRGIAGSVSC
uniref:Uncharacterized protein n=1 Tax=Odontella aurita TaxID=265563 RepID=A0A7S4J6X8_9STRA|mmetsp:Transcript_40320/g.121448  ORF Transcript_40320/g.121448 Transcript_40320/m.121448 type:complete len:493 (+) Transcript_40320:87-1565(+)